MLLDWGIRFVRRRLGTESVTYRRDILRFAKLRAGGLPFGSALALGFGLDHAKLNRDETRYNGAGLDGDRDAIGGDFGRAIEKATPRSIKRG